VESRRAGQKRAIESQKGRSESRKESGTKNGNTIKRPRIRVLEKKQTTKGGNANRWKSPPPKKEDTQENKKARKPRWQENNPTFKAGVEETASALTPLLTPEAEEYKKRKHKEAKLHIYIYPSII
jgi:hypothetical protein